MARKKTTLSPTQLLRAEPQPPVSDEPVAQTGATLFMPIPEALRGHPQPPASEEPAARVRATQLLPIPAELHPDAPPPAAERPAAHPKLTQILHLTALLRPDVQNNKPAITPPKQATPAVTQFMYFDQTSKRGRSVSLVALSAAGILVCVLLVWFGIGRVGIVLDTLADRHYEAQEYAAAVQGYSQALFVTPHDGHGRAARAALPGRGDAALQARRVSPLAGELQSRTGRTAREWTSVSWHWPRTAQARQRRRSHCSLQELPAAGPQRARGGRADGLDA